MRILGVDPGISGAFGLLEASGKYIDCFDMPTVLQNASSSRQMVNQYELAKVLRVVVMDAPDSIVAVVENVNAMPKQGVSSSFAFGKSFGMILGVIGALGVSIELVSPQRWKKEFGLKQKKSPDGTEDNRPQVQDQARSIAQRLFPAAPLGLKKHHARAEALLIAKWYADSHGRREQQDADLQSRTAAAEAQGQAF